LWKEYEKNEWDHCISAGVKERPADCIRINEVAAALKKLQRHKGPGLSGLVTSNDTNHRDIGTQWILDLCNGIVKGCIPEDKGKGDPVECGSYRGSDNSWYAPRFSIESFAICDYHGSFI